MAGACRALQWSEMQSSTNLNSLDLHADKTQKAFTLLQTQGTESCVTRKVIQESSSSHGMRCNLANDLMETPRQPASSVALT